MKKCKCGCGKTIIPKWWHKYYRHDFLKGHHSFTKSKLVKCDFCGKTIRIFVCKSLAHLKHRFCSQQCAGKFKRNQIKLKCHLCDKFFKRKLAQIKIDKVRNKKHHYCSSKCSHIAHRGKYYYIAKYYKPTNHRINSAFWRNLRLEILKRDKYTCQMCKSKKSLSVHHISPYKISKNHNRTNLITLCQSCHGKTDWILFRKKHE